MIRKLDIPQNIADKLMFENDHTCCICRIKGKNVQIHHIDCNNSNNESSNLAVVCLECHSKVTGDEGLGRRYSSGEIKRYKRTWESMSKERLISQLPKFPKENESVSFFAITVSEIVSMKDGDPRIEEKLNTFWELSTMTGCIDEILDALFYLAVRCSTSMKQTSVILADTIYKLFFHFVGPDTINLGLDDEKRLRQAIQYLGTIGRFSGEFTRELEVIESVSNNLYYFYEIASLYNLQEVISLIKSELLSIKETCKSTYTATDNPFKFGADYIDQILEQTHE